MQENKLLLALSVVPSNKKLEINLIAELHLKSAALNITIWILVSSKFQIC